MRRSLAIGGSLTRDDTERLLDACAALLAEREAVARILGELGPSWTGARRALNEFRAQSSAVDDLSQAHRQDPRYRGSHATAVTANMKKPTTPITRPATIPTTRPATIRDTSDPLTDRSRRRTRVDCRLAMTLRD